jgi:protein phosphatase
VLRIAEQTYKSDVGRARQGNEDNFFVRAPVFVVADGMGGAQAGEVASQLAVEAFEAGMPNGSSPEDGLTEIIRTANNRIHEMSRSDQQHSGMGTTCTAAYVDEREVVLAHVGDSRAYLFRGGELTRLTTDHSLVGELVDRGKLTEEQAEMHPQRSVITRALGPELNVRVDTERVEARDGDVFLLCSDGLTSMVREAGLVPILREAKSLDEAGKGLVAAANAAGGRDNITVILFSLEEVDTSGAIGSAEQETSERAAVVDEDEYEDFTGTASAAPRQGVTRESPTLAGEGAKAEVAEQVRATDADEQAYRDGEFATTAHQAITRPPPPRPDPTASAPPQPAATRATTDRERGTKKRRRFPIKGLVVFLVIAGIVLFSAYIAIRAVFFVGVDERQAVTIYRGLPYELPLGVDLYTTHYTSGVTLQQIPAGRREVFTEEKLRTLSDAEDLVDDAEDGKIRP